jgi:hypothetical protein
MVHRTDPQIVECRDTRSRRKIIVKWFPGVRMHKALAIAARRGIEDVKRLLKAAGNDISALEKGTSLTKLISKMRVG